jgi:hypothetical protein
MPCILICGQAAWKTHDAVNLMSANRRSVAAEIGGKPIAGTLATEALALAESFGIMVGAPFALAERNLIKGSKTPTRGYAHSN